MLENHNMRKGEQEFFFSWRKTKVISMTLSSTLFKETRGSIFFRLQVIKSVELIARDYGGGEKHK